MLWRAELMGDLRHHGHYVKIDKFQYHPCCVVAIGCREAHFFCWAAKGFELKPEMRGVTTAQALSWSSFSRCKNRTVAAKV